MTGGSDGIGFEFCKQLAKDGFNICIVSRTESKLIAAADEIKKSFGVETRIVVADFAGKPQMRFLQSIVNQVSDLDIGLVILNAGVSGNAEWVVQEA